MFYELIVMMVFGLFYYFIESEKMPRSLRKISKVIIILINIIAVLSLFFYAISIKEVGILKSMIAGILGLWILIYNIKKYILYNK